MLDQTYFWGNLYTHFANQNEVSDEDGLVAKIAISGKQTTLDQFIAKYEKEAIVSVFGKQLSSDYFNGIEEETIDDKWAFMKSVIYDETNKVSFTANYVWFILDQYTTNTKTMRGSITESISKAKLVNNSTNQIQVFNEYVDLASNAREAVSESDLFADYFAENDIRLPKIEHINRFWL